MPSPGTPVEGRGARVRVQPIGQEDVRRVWVLEQFSGCDEDEEQEQREAERADPRLGAA